MCRVAGKQFSTPRPCCRVLTGFHTFPVLPQDQSTRIRHVSSIFFPGRRPDPVHRSEKEKDLGSRSIERSPMVLSEEQDQTKRNERKDEKNGTEVNTKMSRPRTLLEQLHWKAKDHPKNLPTPNRKASEPRKADGPKERGKRVNG